MLEETEDATTLFVRPAMEIDPSARRPPPTPIPRGLFAAVLALAFGSGFALVVLLLG